MRGAEHGATQAVGHAGDFKNSLTRERLPKMAWLDGLDHRLGENGSSDIASKLDNGLTEIPDHIYKIGAPLEVRHSRCTILVR